MVASFIGGTAGALAIVPAAKLLMPEGPASTVGARSTHPSTSPSARIMNAKAEGVGNVSFRQGDATHLDFPDETFDAVASNYVYHNIPSKDRQAILLETLRTLKKGGTFAIHDIFSEAKYGDMQAFIKKLKEMGYEKVDLIDTTNGKWIMKSEAGWMGLSGSALLTGTK